jgi:hypothetical protein
MNGFKSINPSINRYSPVSGDKNTKRAFPLGGGHVWPVGDAGEQY